MQTSNAITPVEITVTREKREMLIRWQDGHESLYGFDFLRKECPCSSCSEQRSKQAASAGLNLSVLSGPIVRAGEVQAVEVKAVGRYALTFAWSDGHDTGIYSYALLRELCPCPACHAGR